MRLQETRTTSTEHRGGVSNEPRALPQGLRALALLSQVLLWTVFAYHGAKVFEAAVDAPYHDDWALVDLGELAPPALLAGLHVDHPVLFTKLLVLAQGVMVLGMSPCT